MAYFEDLSPYSYSHSGVRPDTLNIGWLDKQKPFPTGGIAESGFAGIVSWIRRKPSPKVGVPKAFLEKLWPYCKLRVVQMRGFHVCEFCDLPNNPFPTYQFQDEEIKLGSAEIRIFGDDGKIFASPNLIFHYVRDHHYLPPESFIQAVLSSPGPESQDYLNRLRALSLLK